MTVLCNFTTEMVILQTPAAFRLQNWGCEYSRSCEDSLNALTNCPTTRTRWKSMFSRMRTSGCWSTGAEWITRLPGGALRIDLCMGLWIHILRLYKQDMQSHRLPRVCTTQVQLPARREPVIVRHLVLVLPVAGCATTGVCKLAENRPDDLILYWECGFGQ